MQRAFMCLSLFVACAASIHAQDVISLKNGMSIKALVQKTDGDDVTFKKYDDSAGTDCTLKKWEIAAINYAGGRKEEFNVTAPPMDKRELARKLPEFENRMNICGFTKRLVVFDFLPAKIQKKQKQVGYLNWCTAGIWLNYEERLVALRLSRDNWDEIIIPMGDFREVKRAIDGVEKTIIRGGIFVDHVETRVAAEKIQLKMVVVSGNKGVQTHAVTLLDHNKRGDSPAFSTKSNAYPVLPYNDRTILEPNRILYKHIEACMEAIENEIVYMNTI